MVLVPDPWVACRQTGGARPTVVQVWYGINVLQNREAANTAADLVAGS